MAWHIMSGYELPLGLAMWRVWCLFSGISHIALPIPLNFEKVFMCTSSVSHVIFSHQLSCIHMTDLAGTVKARRSVNTVIHKCYRIVHLSNGAKVYRACRCVWRKGSVVAWRFDCRQTPPVLSTSTSQFPYPELKTWQQNIAIARFTWP